jgi:hypothetical protein
MQIKIRTPSGLGYDPNHTLRKIGANSRTVKNFVEKNLATYLDWSMISTWL